MKRGKYFEGKLLRETDLAKEQTYQKTPQKKEISKMATGDRKDPYRNFNFMVEIDGIAQAGFSECSGLESDTDVIEYREGNEASTVRKLPGLTKYSNIVLRRGVTDSKELYNWRKDVIDGNIQRKSGLIVLLNEKRQQVARWNFREGWPCYMSGPDLDAMGDEVAIEELEICHEGFERV